MKLWGKHNEIVFFCIWWILHLFITHAQVISPIQGSTECLKMQFFIRAGSGNIQYALLKTLRPDLQKPIGVPDLQNKTADPNIIANGKIFIEEEGRRISREVCGLEPGVAYDTYFATETHGSNGLFSPVGSVLNVSTNELAPMLEGVRVVAEDGQSDAIHVRFAIANPPCTTHYIVFKDNSEQVALLEEDAFFSQAMMSPATVQEPGDWFPGLVTKGSVEVLIAEGNFTVDGLESNTEYKVMLVTEKSKDVFGTVFVSETARTHATAPEFEHCSVAPLHGSTDGIEITVQLACDRFGWQTSLHRESTECGQVLVEVIQETEVAVEPTRKIPRETPSTTTIHSTVTTATFLASEELTVQVLEGLEQNKTYNVSLQVETPMSNGIFGLNCSQEVTTHSIAALILELNASRPANSTNSLVVSFVLSTPSWLHVQVMEAMEYPFSVLSAQEASQYYKTITHLASEENDEGSAAGTLVIEDISASKAYLVKAVPESVTAGALSGVYGSEVKAFVHAQPPMIQQLQARALDGSTTAVEIHYEVDMPHGDIIFLVDLNATANAQVGTSGKHIETRLINGEGVGGSKKKLYSKSDSYLFENLTPNTAYSIMAATVSSSGEFSEPRVLEVSTNGAAPEVSRVDLMPSNASATSLSVEVALSHPGIFHYVLVDSQELMPNIISGNVLHKGFIDLEESPAVANFTLPGLAPNTSYQLFYVSETAGDTGVLGDMSDPTLAFTHPLPPSIVSFMVDPADATSEALSISCNLSSPGLLHYSVSRYNTTPCLCDYVGDNNTNPEIISQATVSPKEDLSASFVVNGLNTSTEYDVCFCTEVEGSFGLLGDPMPLVAIATHAPPPELLSVPPSLGWPSGQSISCTPNCTQFLRDDCWLKENVCGECLEGFVGKRGHSNTPCGPFKPIILHNDREPKGALGPDELRSLNAAPEMEGKEERDDEPPNVLVQKFVGIPVYIQEGVMHFVYIELVVNTTTNQAVEQDLRARKFCEDQSYNDGSEIENCVANLVKALNMQVQQQKFVDIRESLPKFRVNVEVAPDQHAGLIIFSGDDIEARGNSFCSNQNIDEEQCSQSLIPLLHELNKSTLKLYPSQL